MASVSQSTLMFIGAMLLLPPIIFSAWLVLRRHSMNCAHQKLMIRTFCTGMLFVIPALIAVYVIGRLLGIEPNSFIRENLATKSFWVVLVAFASVGLIQEVAKHFVVYTVDYRRREFNRVVDGIEFAIAAALGFSFAENLAYFAITYAHGMLDAHLVVARILESVFAHMIFSGFYGYYDGRARFAGIHHPSATHHLKTIHHGGRQHAERLVDLFMWKEEVRLERDEEAEHEEHHLIAEGLAVAVTLHATFNVLLEFGMAYLAIPLIALEFAVVLKQIHSKHNAAVHLFSRGGTSIVSRVTHEGELEIHDPHVKEILERWDARGHKIKKREQVQDR